jgi:hypothetical protein
LKKGIWVSELAFASSQEVHHFVTKMKVGSELERLVRCHFCNSRLNEPIGVVC